MKSLKILITGITGFVGKHLSRRLLREGHNIFAIIRNPLIVDSLEAQGVRCFLDDNKTMDTLIKFFDDNKFDGVIHLASKFVVEHKPEDILELINSNLLFSTRVLEASVKANVKWFINTGTFWQHYENRDYSPVNFYAATKQAFEAIAQYYLETSDINFLTLKLNDTYGPEDTRPKIFNLWLKIAGTSETLDMSAGEQLIDIVYIDDVVEAYVKAIELLENDNDKKLKGSSFAVSSGKPVKLKELAKIFEEVTGKKLNINWGKRLYRKREVMVPWNKGQTLPNWKPTITIEEGIKRICDCINCD
jgi:nucleoside-diphosphate-sugar epimerase